MTLPSNILVVGHYIEAIVTIGSNSQKALVCGRVDEIDLVSVAPHIPHHIPPIIRVNEQIFWQKCSVVFNNLICNIVTKESERGFWSTETKLGTTAILSTRLFPFRTSSMFFNNILSRGTNFLRRTFLNELFPVVFSCLGISLDMLP